MRSIWIHGPLFFFLLAVSAQLRAENSLPPLEKAVESLPEGLLRTMVLKIAKTVVTSGTDELSRHLYELTTQAESDWQGIRREILSATGGQPLELAIGAASSEINRANEILARSGFDFIVFQLDPQWSVPRTDEVLPEHKGKFSRSQLISRVGSPILIFSIALGASYLESVLTQNSSRSLRPQLAMATAASLFEVLSGFLDAPVRRRLSQISSSSFVWPGAWEVLKNSLASAGILFAGSQFAALPSNPVPFSSMSSLHLVLQVILMSATVSSIQILLSSYQKAGVLSEYPRSVFSSLSAAYGSVARAFGVIPGLRAVGEGLMVFHGLVFSLPTFAIQSLGREATIRATQKRVRGSVSEGIAREGFCGRTFRKLFFKINFKKR